MSSELKLTNIKHPSSGSNNLVLASDGNVSITNTLSAGTLGSSVVFPAGGTGNAVSVAVIADQKSNGVHGGSGANSAWRQRDLNTVLFDSEGSNGTVTVSSDQFVLGAGTYLINFSAPTYETNRHQTRLYDVTGSSALAYGVSSIGAASTHSFGYYKHTITGNNTYTLEHRIHTSVTTYGFGLSCNWGGSLPEIYSIVVIYKLK